MGVPVGADADTTGPRGPERKPAVAAVRSATLAAADQVDANKVALAKLVDAYEALGEALRDDERVQQDGQQ